MEPHEKPRRFGKPRSLTRCPITGKRRFRDHEEAVEALQKARNARKRADGPTRRQERRAYECHICRGWHLTSKETWADQPFDVVELDTRRTSEDALRIEVDAV